jgi:hypothetical protein
MRNGQWINPNSAGLTVAIIIGGWHLIWVVFVALGLAQGFADFVLWLHLIKVSYSVQPFGWAAAISLVVLTTAFGFLLGWGGALLLNRLRSA